MGKYDGNMGKYCGSMGKYCGSIGKYCGSTCKYCVLVSLSSCQVVVNVMVVLQHLIRTRNELMKGLCKCMNVYECV